MEHHTNASLVIFVKYCNPVLGIIFSENVINDIRLLVHLRNLNYLGQKAGFSKESADARIAQYENYSRNPKKEILDQLSLALGVSPDAIKAPNIDSYVGLMHTLFAIQDIYGLKIDAKDDDICLRLDKSKGQMYVTMHQMLLQWKEQQAKLDSGEISQEEYDNWRYNYPISKLKK